MDTNTKERSTLLLDALPTFTTFYSMKEAMAAFDNDDVAAKIVSKKGPHILKIFLF